MYPAVKIILMLRDPVTRAFSQYNHMRQQTRKLGDECYLKVDLRKSFRELIQEDMSREDALGEEPVALANTPPQTMLRRGYYMEQIEHILTLFPRDQLLVVIQERYNKDMLKHNNVILEYLGLNPLDTMEEVHEHKRSYEEEMGEDDKKWLAGLYKNENEKLFEFLGERIQEWTT